MGGQIKNTQLDPNFVPASTAILTDVKPASAEELQARINAKRDRFEISHIEETLREHLTREEYRMYEHRAYGERGTNRRPVILAEARRALADLKLPDPADEDCDEDYTPPAELYGLD